MKTDSAFLIATIAEMAPGLNLSVTWEEDPHFVWDGAGRDPRRNGYLPYDVTVTARIIQNGQFHEGHSYLGGCYDKPGKLCPQIHGYWNQMVEEAIMELPSFEGKDHALALLHEARLEDYRAQMATL